MTEYAVAFVTCAGLQQARDLGRKILEKRLAACVNIVPAVESMYWWQGKITGGNETLLIFKTQKSLVRDFVSAVKEIHGYDVPEIIFLDISSGNEDYLRWIEEETS